MTSGEKAEPERSAISSTEHKKHCLTHPFGDPHTDGKCCLCGITREELDEPEPQDVHKGPPCSGCGHPQHSQRCSKMTSLGEDEMGHCGCIELTALNDIIETCRRAGGCPMHPVLPPEPRCEGCGHTDGEGCGCPPRCTCGCPKGAHMGKPRGCIPHGFHEYEDPEAHDFVSPAHCAACMRSWLPPDSVPAAEPPLTPEEEEEASQDMPCTCSARTENEDGFVAHDEDCDAREEPHPFRAYCRVCDDVHEPHKDCPSPPQPDRRPPYLLAYSVQGHLYEVALPGDATVAALDGRLVITHQLGPVAGICQIAPITSEES